MNPYPEADWGDDTRQNWNPWPYILFFILILIIINLLSWK